VSLCRTYLDYNATTPLHPEARAAFVAALDLVGNASSIHAEGRRARALVETARSSVAKLVGADASRVTFTSGGTEALNLALTPQLVGHDRRESDVLFIAAGEHACVQTGHRFAAEQVETIALDASGRLDLSALEAAIARRTGNKVMLALQAANNETGVIQPVAEAAALIHAAGGLVVCDAVQMAGRQRCDINDLGADVLALSAHKIGGPQGAGALCFASDELYLGAPLIRGGGQERGLRAGTENVAAIAGFGAAADIAFGVQDSERICTLRDKLEAELAAMESITIFGRDAVRLANTTCFALQGVEAQVLLMLLDIEGIAVSSGSACSSGKIKPSHVLRAMGVSEDLAKGAIRVSLGWKSQVEDVEAFCRAFAKAVKLVRVRQLTQTQNVKSAA